MVRRNKYLFRITHLELLMLMIVSTLPMNDMTAITPSTMARVLAEDVNWGACSKHCIRDELLTVIFQRSHNSRGSIKRWPSSELIRWSWSWRNVVSSLMFGNNVCIWMQNENYCSSLSINFFYSVFLLLLPQESSLSNILEFIINNIFSRHSCTCSVNKNNWSSNKVINFYKWMKI